MNEKKNVVYCLTKQDRTGFIDWYLFSTYDKAAQAAVEMGGEYCGEDDAWIIDEYTEFYISEMEVY